MLVAVQAALQRAHEAWGHRGAADATVAELDVVLPVDDGVAARHLVRDVAERRRAVHHLEQDATQAPDVAGLTELHKLRSWRVGYGTDAVAADVGRVGIDQTLWAHVVGSTDLGFTVHVDSLVSLDRVGNAEVDELEAALHQDKIGWL